MITNGEEWLKLTIESPIDPALPICDPHQHFIDRPGHRYLIEDLMKDIKNGHNIVKTMHMECQSSYRQTGPDIMKPVGETEFVQAISAKGVSGQYGKTAVAAGIIGRADLAVGNPIKPVLESHIEAGKGFFRGVRYVSVWDTNPEIPIYMNTPKGILSNSTFREGFACLKQYGLTFDAMVLFHQLNELAELAKAFPDISIITGHTGGFAAVGTYAEKRQEVLDVWKRGIATLAACPNVYMKLGGLGQKLCGFGWQERATPPGSIELAKAMEPYYLWCIEKFGAKRCMFESNFPVDRESYSYTVMWNAFKLICKGFSTVERADLFHDTASRVYHLV
jgi:L-fuconolactonase